MSYHDKMLIKSENRGTGKLSALILDDHKAHLLGHLLFIWKPSIFKHFVQHVKLWKRQKEMGIPSISVEDVINAQRSNRENRNS